MKSINLYPTTKYPCDFDDLIDKKGNVFANIYTKKEAKKDNRKVGITKAKEGIYDIVIDAPEIKVNNVKKALKNLESITKEKYNLIYKKEILDSLR